MNKKIKLLFIAFAIFLMCLFVASCSNKSVYDEYDDDGYKVTIRYDANGGYFGNAGQLYVNDTYNLGKYRVNENGMKELRLIDLNDASRGKANRYPLDPASNVGYFHAGWYTEKTAMKDANGNLIKDDLGNVVYSYSGKIKFPQTIEIDPKKEYSADEPAVTVYAAWVRCPQIEVYEKVNGKDVLVGTYEVSKPLTKGGDSIILPSIDSETGYMKFNTLASVGDWQERTYEDHIAMTDNGPVTIKVTKFFDGFYLDSARQNKLSGTSYKLPFVYDEETATIKNTKLKLYTGYEERVGEWYKIYTASQLEDTANETASYEILADLVFTERVSWPNAFRTGTFEGKIFGNGHTISNISIDSTNGQYFGMFKEITTDAVIENITFDNVVATLDKSYRYPGGRYALFAAVISGDENGERKPFENVNIINSKLVVCASAYTIETSDYEVGLLCADGYSESLGIDISGISYETYEEEYDIYTLKISKGADGNQINLLFEIKPEEEE